MTDGREVSGEEIFYVRVCLTGPPANMARATRYAKEGVMRSTQSLEKSLGVSSSVGVFTATSHPNGYRREQTTLIGDAEEPPLFLDTKESDG